MNPSGIRKMPRNTPEHREESTETGAGQNKFGEGSQVRAFKFKHAVNLSECADLPYVDKEFRSPKVMERTFNFISALKNTHHFITNKPFKCLILF